MLAAATASFGNAGIGLFHGACKLFSVSPSSCSSSSFKLGENAPSPSESVLASVQRKKQIVILVIRVILFDIRNKTCVRALNYI